MGTIHAQSIRGKTMRNNLACAALLGVIVLSGCGSKQDANEKNFGAAIEQYLDKKGELCLGLNTWPKDVTEMDLQMNKILPNDTVVKMAALQSIGLASSVDIEIEGTDFLTGKPDGIKSRVKRYSLTEVGKKSYYEKEVMQTGLDGPKKATRGDICYGKKSLTKVVKWEGPIKLGDYQEARVIYLYRVKDLVDWAKKPEFQAAFPYARQIIEDAGSKVQRHAVKLTSIGWEALGLDI